MINIIVIVIIIIINVPKSLSLNRGPLSLLVFHCFFRESIFDILKAFEVPQSDIAKTSRAHLSMGRTFSIDSEIHPIE